MAAKTKKAKPSSKSTKAPKKATAKSASKTSKATNKPKATKAAGKVKASPKAKATTKKAAPIKNAKTTAKAAVPKKVKTTQKSAATPAKAKTKETDSGLEVEVSKKAKTPKMKETDRRRSQAAALIEAAMDDNDDDDDDDEFDPEAFLAASGGKGLIRSHIMRKERVDLNIPVRYRFIKGPLVQNAILLNLSKTGLCLEGKEKLKEQTVLRIEVPLPHTSELFAIQAEVIWSEKAPGASGKNAPHHIGLNFLPMSLAKKTVINNFIQQRRDEIVMAKIGLDRFGETAPVSGLD